MTSSFKLFLVSLALLVGCASREAGWEKRAEKDVVLSTSEASLTKKEALRLWGKRFEQESLEEALSKFELVHNSDPKDLDTLIYLTRGHYLLADAHLQNMDLKKRNFEKAASFGEKAMATNDAFRAKVTSGASVEESLGTLTKKEVPAIYWTAASLGKWAKASGIAAALKYKTRIKAMVERVEKLQPDYFHGAVPRYWGSYYAVAPSFAGGDMKKSRANFEKSIKLAPAYLGTKVLMAELYWTKQGDKSQFEKLLQEVANSRPDVIRELEPENMLEQRKARALLKNIDEIF